MISVGDIIFENSDEESKTQSVQEPQSHHEKGFFFCPGGESPRGVGPKSEED